MSIRVTCDCGKVLIAKDEYAGKKAKCPDCGNVLLVPSEEVLDAEAADQGDLDFTSNDEADSESDDRRACPACGEDIKRTAAKCRYCGEILDPNLKQRSGRGSSRRGSDATADLGKRFLGSLADGLAAMVFVGPGAALLVAADEGGGGDDSPLAITGLVLLGVGVLALLGLQLYLLGTRSQSIGKYMVKTQIHDYESGGPAGFVKCFLLRGIVSGLIGAVPCIGHIYNLADICFIFGEEHRCLHDRIAGTYVVDIS